MYTNSQVDSAANVIIDNVIAGHLTLGSSQAGTPLALLQCSDGRPMSVSHTSAAPAMARWGCVGSAPEGGGGNGSASGGGSTYAFTPFNNSANGICIIDHSGDCFAVDRRTQRLSFIGPVSAVAIHDTGATPSRTYANARGLYKGTVLVGLAADGQRLADVYAVNLQSSGKRGPAFICDQKTYAEIYENPDRPGDALLRCTDQLASF